MVYCLLEYLKKLKNGSRMIQNNKFIIGEGDSKHPYTARFDPSDDDIKEIQQWCKQVFNGRCTFTISWIWFKNVEDRDWFILRWSGV